MNLTFLTSNECITMTSSPGQRCLQPLHGSVAMNHGGYGPLSEHDSFPADSPSDESIFQAAAPLPVLNLSAVDDTTICVEMTCSAAGTVLVDGMPCDASALPLAFYPPLSRCNLPMLLSTSKCSLHASIACSGHAFLQTLCTPRTLIYCLESQGAPCSLHQKVFAMSHAAE
jgi:hypothetical protein